MCRYLPLVLVFVFGLLGAALPARAGEEVRPADDAVKPGHAESPDYAAALEQARVGGKYRMLFRQIQVPGDVASYGALRDWGLWSGTAYKGHTDLPAGYWVYVHPCWYIWREVATDEIVHRRWGPEQAAGEPDTETAGDHQTAWAASEPDAGEEWLLLEWEDPHRPAAVLIHETFHPGAIVKVTGFRLDGEEIVLWEGELAPDGEKALTVLPVPCDSKIARVKLYLDTSRKEGWNEIDAVGLVDSMGTTHWAARAHASSFYGEKPPPSPLELRIPAAGFEPALRLPVPRLPRVRFRLDPAARAPRSPLPILVPPPVRVELERLVPPPPRPMEPVPAPARPAPAPAVPAPPVPVPPEEERVRRLQQEVEHLRAEIEELREAIRAR